MHVEQACAVATRTLGEQSHPGAPGGTVQEAPTKAFALLMFRTGRARGGAGWRTSGRLQGR